MPRKYHTLTPLTQQEINHFWSKIDKTPGHGPWGNCWLWTKGLQSKGYGEFSYSKHRTGSHRVAYFLQYGDPGSVFVCHRCDIKRCCNPVHLFPGDTLANNRDRQQKGGYAKGREQNQAKLTDGIVRSARTEYAAGTSIRKLAKQYGVNSKTMWAAVNRQRWRHVN